MPSHINKFDIAYMENSSTSTRMTTDDIGDLIAKASPAQLGKIMDKMVEESKNYQQTETLFEKSAVLARAASQLGGF